MKLLNKLSILICILFSNLLLAEDLPQINTNALVQKYIDHKIKRRNVSDKKFICSSKCNYSYRNGNVFAPIYSLTSSSIILTGDKSKIEIIEEMKDICNYAVFYANQSLYNLGYNINDYGFVVFNEFYSGTPQPYLYPNNFNDTCETITE